jgi:plasmid maintenance system killer protein
LRDLMNDTRKLQREFGAENARRVRRRLDDLHAAAALEDLRNTPGRLHELTHNRKGQLAFDLFQGKRLVFEPAHDPPPLKPDGGLDWSRITQIRILESVNYHKG